MPPEAPKASPGTGPVLETVNLVKRYGRVTALDGISLSISPGQVTAILGPSGSGKSTLLRCMNLLELPDSGEVRFMGAAARKTEQGQDAHRSRIGMVFQQFNLFPHLKVWENVALAPRVVGRMRASDAREKALALLARVGLEGKSKSHPSELSGGQQQRAAIARALAMEPALILFDEPTSALDPELTGEVLEVIRLLAAEGRTLVVVTHEVAFARALAADVVFMDAGRVVERGTPSEVIDAPRSDRAARFFSR
jgi:ABC-type polar amino acid transport system ATPase subunit